MRILPTALRNLFDGSTDSFTLVDRNGLVRYANGAARELFGLDREAAGTVDLRALVAPDSLDWDRIVDGDDAAVMVERGVALSLALRDGRVVVAELTRIEGDLDDAEQDRYLLMIRASALPDAKGKAGDPQLLSPRFALLAEASRVFGEASLDLEALMETISRSVSSYVGDTCVIRLLSSDGQWLNPVAVYHPDPESRRLARAFNAAYNQRADRGPAAGVLKSAQPLLIPQVDQAELRDEVFDEYDGYLDRVGISSLIVAPLRVRGQVIGTLGLARGNGGTPYTDDDAALVQELADRAALAVDNARLYRAIADELTERKEVEERYRLVTQVTSDAVWDWNMVSDTIHRTVSARPLFGYHTDAISGDVAWWFDRVHPDDSDRVEQSIHAAIDRGQTFWSCEYRYRRGDGSYAQILDRAQLVRDADGRPLRMIGAMSDISATKEAEHALRLSEEKYRSLIEHSPDVAWIAQAPGIIHYISPNVERVYGYADEEVRAGSPWFWANVVHPDDIGDVTEAFRRLFEEGRPYTIEYRIIRKDGRTIWILDRSNAPYERDGVLYADGVCTDITERKEAAASMQLFRKLVNQSDDSLVIVDAVSGRFLDLNDVACTRLGYTREEFLRLSVSDIQVVMPTRRAWLRHYATIKARGSVIVEGEHRCKDGGTMPVEVNAKLVTIDKAEYIVLVARDITERRRADAALKRAHDILAARVEEQTLEVLALMHRVEETRTSQRRFVAGASHDLRTPLTIVQAEVDLLRRQPEHDERTREALDRIHAESKRLDRLASDLLVLATLDSLNTNETIESVHIEELIIDCVSEINPLATTKNIVCTIHLDDAEPVPCTRQMMHRALLNVLENSIMFSSEGGSVDVSLAMAGERVMIEVADHGVGIDPEDLPKVFDRFRRGDVARSSAGSGLGLSIVKAVVEAHGGEVTIESALGRGTIVRMYLPV